MSGIGYARVMMKVGEMIFCLMPKALAKPWTKVVLPAPKSPDRAITAPLVLNLLANFLATCWVSSGEWVR